jgi:glycine/D-amino acid oxidase-like deaminating enzyme
MPVIDVVKGDDVLPASSACVVIGGGIIGITTALELAERGLDVVVVEKGEVACEQSSRNWGWCRQTGRDPREIPLIKVSLELWRGMNQRIQGETGFQTCGIAYLSDTAQEQSQREAWCRNNAKIHGLDTQLVTSSDVDRLVPGAIRQWAGGMYTPSDGRAEPFIAVPAMARAVRTMGGKIFKCCAARGVELKAGRVSAVVTERGTIATDSVVVAGGYWSRRLLDTLHVRFPQLGVVNSVMRTAPLDAGISTTFSGDRFAVRQRLDGGYTIAHNHYSVAEMTPANFRFMRDYLPLLKLDHRGLRFRIGQRFIGEALLKRRWRLDEVTPFEQLRILNPEPYDDILDEAAAALKARYPAFAPMRIAGRWAGMIDSLPDAVPVIDKIAAIPGLHVASGFSGHGFGLGPGAGKLMAEIVTGEKTCVEATPFRHSRFVDGSRPKPTTGV